jgi:hypothetical protein
VYDLGVILQAVLHVKTLRDNVRELWGRDPWFAQELARYSGRRFLAETAVDSTPVSASELGVVWLDFGKAGRMGLLPVSDGTDIVLQIYASVSQGIWERLFHSTERHLRLFSAAAKHRLESAVESPGRHHPWRRAA